jgi:hypothetical protein
LTSADYSVEIKIEKREEEKGVPRASRNRATLTLLRWDLADKVEMSGEWMI